MDINEITHLGQITRQILQMDIRPNVVADPGFPIGGHRPVGVPTSDIGVFWGKRVQQRKNWGPLGGAHAGAAPWIRQ